MSKLSPSLLAARLWVWFEEWRVGHVEALGFVTGIGGGVCMGG